MSNRFGNVLSATSAFLLASIVLVVALPAQLAGFIEGAMGWSIWLPMLVFEVVLGLWLLIKGVAAPATSVSRRF